MHKLKILNIKDIKLLKKSKNLSLQVFYKVYLDI